MILVDLALCKVEEHASVEVPGPKKLDHLVLVEEDMDHALVGEQVLMMLLEVLG